MLQIILPFVASVNHRLATLADTLQCQMQWRKKVQGHERTWTEVKELVFCSCKDAEIASIKQRMRLTAI